MTLLAVPDLQKPSQASVSAGLSCRTVESAASIPAEWRELCQEHDALMDQRFLAAVQDSAPPDQKYWFLTFSDEAGQTAAAACISQFVVDGVMFSQPWLRWWIEKVRWVFPRYLKFRVLFCGLPVSTAGSNLRIADGADRPAVMAALDKELVGLARRQRAWLTVPKEFEEHELVHADLFRNLGYVRVDSLPMNTFRHRYPSYDAFLADVRSHYRYKINRSRKKFAKAGMTVEHLADPAAITALYTLQLHQLYVDVVDKAEHKLEILPYDFFIELVRQFGSQVSLTVVRQEEKIVAFGWGLLTGHVYRNLFVGIDYCVSDDSDVYFNLMMHDLDFGLRQGATELLVGQTSDVFKSRLGCQTEPRYVYIKASARWLQWAMRATAGWLFPPFTPPPPRDLLKPAEAAQFDGAIDP